MNTKALFGIVGATIIAAGLVAPAANAYPYFGNNWQNRQVHRERQILRAERASAYNNGYFGMPAVNPYVGAPVNPYRPYRRHFW